METDYWKKDYSPSEKILWNVPEMKTGILQVVGGNSQNFSTEIRQVEFLNSLNLQEVRLLLPDSLRKSIPPVPGVNFSASTESGSFDKSRELSAAFVDADATIVLGDVSKNSITSVALTEAIKNCSPSLSLDGSENDGDFATKPRPGKSLTSDKLVVLTRDAVDALAESANEFIERDNLVVVASLVQIQKLLHALLYPKMVMLSQPIFPVIETLHKFTLSYKTTILTFHQGQIIVAFNGEVVTIPIEKTSFSPLSLWAGTLACKVAALNLWNPNESLEATATAIMWRPF